MYQVSKRSRDRRIGLAERMKTYYRTSAAYFDHVHESDAGRPSQEEREMYQAVAKSLGQVGGREIRVLELGCGRAKSIRGLLELFEKSKYHGIEVSAAAVAAARNDNPTYDVRTGDITSLPFSESTFDVVVFNYVLEHLPEPYKLLDEALRVLRPGGIVGMVVPVSDLPWSLPWSLRYRSQSILFLAAFTVRRWLQQLRVRYDPTYFAFEMVEYPQVLARPDSTFRPDDDLVYVGTTLEITKYLRRKGCEVTSILGRDIDPYIRSGRRAWVDTLRTLGFAAYRYSLMRLSKTLFTTTVSIVARK